MPKPIFANRPFASSPFDIHYSMADTILPHALRKDSDPYSTNNEDAQAFHFDFDDMKSIPLASATIKNVVDEPLFWHGYTSEEEMASPVAPDDLSISEDDFDDDSDSMISSRKSSLDESTESVQSSTESLCIEAQAVTMLSLRPKMVSVPKMAAVHPAKRRLVNSIGGNSSDKIVVPGLRSTSMETSRYDDATDTYSFASFEWAKGYPPPSPTASSTVHEDVPSPVYDQPVPVRHTNSTSRHVPLMVAARNLAPLTEAVADVVSPGTAYGHRRSQSSSSRPPLLSTKESMMSMADQYKKHEKPSFRRSPTFGSNFSISNLLKRTDSIRDVEREYSEHMTKSRHVESYSPPLPVPSRSSSISTSKRLVARGGNERAPAITLPDCPSDVEVNQWPFRSSALESTQRSSSPNRRPRKLQRHDAARIMSVN